MDLRVYKRRISYGYAILFFFPYVILSYIFMYDKYSSYVNLLAELTIISIITFCFSLNVNFGLSIKIKKATLVFDEFINKIFSLFIIIVFIIIITADKIPILESIRGASESELNAYRESFVKTRTGIESSLGYIIGMISTFFLPYIILLSFYRNHKNKYIYLAIFLMYSTLFLEKAYFLKIAIPLFFLYAFYTKNLIWFTIKGLIFVLFGFLIMYSLATKLAGSENNEDFFSILYVPTGSLEAIIWRSGVVPIVTAIDGLRVFFMNFNGELFYGDTSSLIAFVKGTERINFERYLYQVQMQGGTESGNANQFFLVEAFINFGYFGVVFFSMLLGKIVKHLVESYEIVLISIIPLIFINLFSSGLIGNLFSNGLLFLYIFIWTSRFDNIYK
jgi:hypothetical protein